LAGDRAGRCAGDQLLRRAEVRRCAEGLRDLAEPAGAVPADGGERADRHDRRHRRAGERRDGEADVGRRSTGEAAMMNLLMHLEWWHWWIAAAVLAAIETFMPGAVAIWFAISAAVVGALVLIIPVPWQLQLVLFG